MHLPLLPGLPTPMYQSPKEARKPSVQAGWKLCQSLSTEATPIRINLFKTVPGFMSEMVVVNGARLRIVDAVEACLKKLCISKSCQGSGPLRYRSSHQGTHSGSTKQGGPQLLWKSRIQPQLMHSRDGSIEDLSNYCL